MEDAVRISFDGIGKRFGQRVVFRGLGGEAAPGEVLVIRGPNGSGKSTLLTILCGLLRATRGSVRHVGVAREIPREMWRHHLGVVAPAIAVYRELDALENLRFLARVRGMGRSDERCRECLEMVGLDPGRRTLVRGYSTGMTQRLKIAQAVLHEPPVLVLDEPGANLDPDGKRWLESTVRDLAEGGKTIILATNDPGEMEWGTRRVELAG